LPKQYSFKTTRATEWMEEVLDSLPPSERSRFVREAIHYFLSKKKDKEEQRNTFNDKVEQTKTTNDKERPSQPKHTTEEPVSIGKGVEEVVDFNNMLDNLYKEEDEE
jgi:hypothetical protein